ncbi:MAG: nucleotide exchange factor GrpE [Planctomycetota bacterium]|nr:MAG: nucleotide exchange factor GrpE [Planctomycetota bacterium]
MDDRKTMSAARSKTKASKPQPNVQAAADSGEPNPSPETAAEQAAAAGASQTTTDPVEALRAEIEALKDQNLRLAAELRNVQQRAQREKQEALRFAEADFAKSLLPVLDDFERTLASAAGADSVEPVLEGVRIVYEHLLKALKLRHIEPIPAKGERFDPDVHEALMQQPSDTVDAGMVIDEAARGFKMHERVLRPAKVIVSSGPAEKTNDKQE